MNDFEKIGKTMPYNESESYVSSVIEQCTKNALSAGHEKESKPKKKAPVPVVTIGGSIAALLVMVVGLIFSYKESKSENPSIVAQIKNALTLDEALSTLTDEQIDNIGSYCTDFPDFEYCND